MANPRAPTDPIEPIYGVQLLDDLHIYFPDILYNSDRFATVPDLLQYVQNQTRAHFNLFNRGRLLYQVRHAQQEREAPLPLPRRSVRPSPAASASAVAPSASAVPAPSFPPAPPLATPLLSAPLRSAITAALQETPASSDANANVEIDVSGQEVPVNATPVATPRPAVMLPTPTPPRPASVPAPASIAAGGAGTGTGAGVRTTSTTSVTASTPLFTTTYASAVRGFNSASHRTLPNAPFRAPRTEPSVLFQFDTGGGFDQFGTDMTGLGNTTQLLTSLLGLTFGDTGGLGGLATGGLPASFLEPVTVRPTSAQIDAASEVLTLSVPLEGNCAVCQDSLETGNVVRRLTACTHAFHQECIDTWFERSVQCPVCRHDVRETVTSQTPASTTPSELD